jgi:hypothetical protein
LPYKKLQEDEVATSRSDGSKDPGSLYKYRKGAAANLSKSSVDEREIMQVLMSVKGTWTNTPGILLWVIAGVTRLHTMFRSRTILNPPSWVLLPETL